MEDKIYLIFFNKQQFDKIKINHGTYVCFSYACLPQEKLCGEQFLNPLKWYILFTLRKFAF